MFQLLALALLLAALFLGDSLYKLGVVNENLDIRNGKKPRPKQYEEIYWDFRAVGIDPNRGTDAAIPLQELMKKAGFTDAEFAKLQAAQSKSDDLVNTETVAMNLVKGQLADGKGGFTLKGEPDLAKAREMLHDKTYHANKAKVMKPVDEFLTLVDQRTAHAVTDAVDQKNLGYRLLVASIALLLLVAIAFLAAIVRTLMGRFGADPMAVRHAVETVRKGDLSADIPVRSGDTTSVMAALSGMQAHLSKVVSDVRQGSQAVALASNEIAQGNMDLSNRTEDQASALEKTASYMNELGSQVKQNASSANPANELAQSASKVASQGGEVVESFKLKPA